MFQVLKKIKNSISKKHLLILILVGGVLIFLPQLIEAANCGTFDLVCKGQNLILLIMKHLTTLPLKAATSMLNWVLEGGFLAQDIGYQPHNNDIIKAGWEPVRNFANMFFIVGLIIIGVATALQYEEYKAQKALPKLLIVALLINFTPALAAAVIDFADAATEAFLAEAGAGGFTTIEQTMETPGGAQANSIQGYVGSYMSELSNADTVGALGEAFFLMLFGWGATLILFMFAFLFMARYVVLWLLIIVSPIAFFSYIFPAAKEKIWDDWWEQFVNWCIIGIPAAITLLLGKEVLMKANEMTTDAGMGDSLAEGLITFIITFTLPLLFLVIGYLATLKVSAMGSEAIINGAKASGKWVAGAAGKGAWKGAEATGVPDRVRNRLEDMRTSRSIAEREEEAEEKGEEFDEDYGAATRVASGALARSKRTIGRWALRQGSTTTERVEGKVDDAEETDPGEKVSTIKSGATGKMDEMTQILAGIEEGQLKTMKKMGLSNSKIKQAAITASKVAPQKAEDIVNSFPTIADEVAEELTDEQKEKTGLTMSQAEKDKYGSLTAKVAADLDLNEIENLNEEAFKNENFMKGVHLDWSGRELSKAGQEHGRDFVEQYNEQAKGKGRDKQWFEKNNKGAANYLSNDAAQGMGYMSPYEKQTGKDEQTEESKIEVSSSTEGTVKFSSKERNISDEEFERFTQENEVTQERLETIAKQLKKNNKLRDREKQILQEKNSEIENILNKMKDDSDNN
ncbi:MAG: hypothetical protein V5A57_00945 [Candidatus Paceibacterota bacterium]